MTGINVIIIITLFHLIHRTVYGNIEIKYTESNIYIDIQTRRNLLYCKSETEFLYLKLFLRINFIICTEPFTLNWKNVIINVVPSMI